MVVYRYDLGSEPAVLTSSSSVDLNTWHTVTITRSGKQGTLQVNDEPTVSNSSQGSLTGLNLGDYLWLGGHTNHIDISAFSGISNGFMGCISSLEINGVLFDLDMDAEGGLGVAECNVSTCEGNPCLNGGTCTQVGNSFTCDCPPSHHGPLCANDVDHCSTDPCSHTQGGVCVEYANGTGYYCLCPIGYSGTLCENG